MSIYFKNNIKNIRTTTPDYQLFVRGNCPEPCLRQFFLEYIPIYNQTSTFSSVSSSTARNFNNSRPIYVILRNEKSLLKYLIHENSECQHFLFLKKQSQNFFTFQFLLFIQRAAISGSQSQTSLFCVIYLYICNISISMYYIYIYVLYLAMDF